MSDTARLFAMAVDSAAHARGSDLDAEERAAMLATVDKCGELTICAACHGSGWGPGVGETPRRHKLCDPCRGYGAVSR